MLAGKQGQKEIDKIRFWFQKSSRSKIFPGADMAIAPARKPGREKEKEDENIGRSNWMNVVLGHCV